MDIRRICEELSDRWPEWGERISLLQFLEADGLGAAANDGRSVIYNDRLMSYYTQESVLFEIPGTDFPVPLPYILTYKEVQLSGVLK